MSEEDVEKLAQILSSIKPVKQPKPIEVSPEEFSMLKFKFACDEPDVKKAIAIFDLLSLKYQGIPIIPKEGASLVNSLKNI